jgi:hypothetical protein
MVGRRWRVVVIVACVAAAGARPLAAQTTDPPQTPPAKPLPTQTVPPAPTPACPPAPEGSKQPDQTPQKNDPNRIFGVLPNYTSVDKCTAFAPLTTKATFVMTARGAFDKVVFPFTAVTAGIAQLEDQSSSYGQGWEGYAKRYVTSFADNTLATFTTTAIMPTLLRQDPRYFVKGTGGGWHRTYYALSRTVITLSRTGHKQFNMSDIGGNLAAAGMMNFYHPPEDRNLLATLNRWGMQCLFDGMTNVLKEFWPDMKRHFHKTKT